MQESIITTDSIDNKMEPKPSIPRNENIAQKAIVTSIPMYIHPTENLNENYKQVVSLIPNNL